MQAVESPVSQVSHFTSQVSLRIPHLRDRFEDIFSEVLVHKLVFDDDHRTYLRNYATNYSVGYTRYDGTLEEAFMQTFEVLARGFLITDPFRRPHLYWDANPADITDDLVADSFVNFQQAVADMSSFVLDFEDVFRKVPEWKMRYYFERVFSESYHPVRCISEDIQIIYNEICHGNASTPFAPGLDPSPDDVHNLTEQIARALRQGRPLVRIRYRDPRPNRDLEDSAYLDALFLVRTFCGSTFPISLPISTPKNRPPALFAK